MPPVGGERIGLAPRAIEGEHELAPGTFAERIGLDQGLEFADDLEMAPQGEVGLDAALEG